jgi:hypothetical protein
LNRLVEGWGSPLGSLSKGRAQKHPAPALWHYYAGLEGLGGRFNSLCGRATFPHDANLHKELPQTAYLICGECQERVNAANS